MKTVRAANAVGWLGLIGLGTLLLACGQEGPESEGSDNVGSVSEALVTPDQVHTDGSGQIRIMVRTCDWPANFTAGAHCALCALDKEWVLVGGGAEIAFQAQGSTAAKLRGSFPYPNAVTDLNPNFGAGPETCTVNPSNNDNVTDYVAWGARSNGGTSHKLRAYAIGIQVAGKTAAELRSNLFWSDQTSDSSLTPSFTTTPGAAGSIIGGGANMLGNAHAYLTESRPASDASSWIGAGRTSDGIAAGVKVYYMSGTNLGLVAKVRSATGSAGTALTSASVSTPYPWVTTSIGARGLSGASYSASRTLRGLIPFASATQGVLASSAPEVGASVNGATTAYSINIYQDEGPFAFWLNNNIRSASFGTSFSRPAGAAPVRLQESTTMPTGAQTNLRWHLEDMGAGRVRIRNANPSSPESGECAFWSGAATNQVQVGPCAATNAFLWTYSAFQFKNVASNTCLKPTGINNSNIPLVACVFDGSQLFSLGAAGWPN